MAFRTTSLLALLALATISSANGLHLATKGLLQIHPSFTGPGITLYPAHHPDHNSSDLSHLSPQLSNELYYSQEGHRPAYHGAKHGSLKTNFSRPTVVLDHSSHLKTVKCDDKQGNIKVCFDSLEAFQVAQQSWNKPDFHLNTFHMGCGDQTSGKRTYFHARKPVFMDPQTLCTVVPVTPLKDEDAMDSGELSWGTYKHPNYRKRVPVLGHIRLDEPPTNLDTDASIDPLVNSTTPILDLTQNATALEGFFFGLNFNTDNISDPAPPGDDLVSISDDGTVSVPFDSANSTEANGSNETVSRRDSPQSISHRSDVALRDGFEPGIAKRDFVDGIVNAIRSLINAVARLFEVAAKIIAVVATIIIQVAVISAKLVLVAFGVPFKHSYHNDFKFNFQPSFGATNRPPAIFGLGEGFEIASDGTAFAIQCAKCGISGDFSVDGRLAFSIQDGITDGTAALVNNNPFTIDAQFGISVETVAVKEQELFKKELGALPLSPLTIPGIITFGPQISISAEVDASLTGQAELLVGGSLSISPGRAVLSLVERSENKLEGLDVTFTPVFKLSGSLTATVQLGVPIAIEIGLDILNGKFKKTVGLIDKPSVYASAIVSSGQGNACNNGVELRVGVKNRIYVAALDLWDYTIRTDIIYEKSLTCITAEGFNTGTVQPSVVFNSVIKESGGEDVGDSKENITDVAQGLIPKQSTTGYRIIMDEAQTSILVAGVDGFIYLVDSEKGYDTSAPWGTIDLTSNVLNIDVLGRLFGSKQVNLFGGGTGTSIVGEVRLFKPDQVPKGYRASCLSEIKQSDAKGYQAYGLTVGKPGESDYEITFPTVCKTDNGTRLYTTQFLIDKDGIYRNPMGKIYSPKSGLGRHLTELFKRLGVNDSANNCRTIRLTSRLN